VSSAAVSRAVVSRAGVIRTTVIVGAIGLVELLCRSGVISNFTMPPPSAIVHSMIELLASGRFTADILITLRNVALAIIAAMTVGVAAATILQSSPGARRVLDPLFATYYAIPVYAFYPLLIVIFGLGDLPQIAVGFLLAVMAVLINTLNGLDRVPRVLHKVARVHHLSPVATALRVRLPFAAPYIFTGFKLCVAYSFVGVSGAEFITSNRGIGYEIAFAYNNFENRVMYPLIVFILLVVTIVNMSLYAWERRLQARRQR
jgi:NitT/TauT family transport system permease protein